MAIGIVLRQSGVRLEVTRESARSFGAAVAFRRTRAAPTLAAVPHVMVVVVVVVVVVVRNSSNIKKIIVIVVEVLRIQVIIVPIPPGRAACGWSSSHLIVHLRCISRAKCWPDKHE
jgi:hypothetical protein